MAFFAEWLDQLEDSFSNEVVEEILNRIRTSPFMEIDGDIFAGECPIWVIYNHYSVNGLTSQRDLDVLFEITQAFHQRGVPLDRRGEEDTTLLHFAIDFGDNNLNLVRYLIENGVNLNIAELGETTALQQAMDLGRMDIANLLIENGAHHTNEQYFTVYMYKEPDC